MSKQEILDELKATKMEDGKTLLEYLEGKIAHQLGMAATLGLKRWQIVSRMPREWPDAGDFSKGFWHVMAATSVPLLIQDAPFVIFYTPESDDGAKEPLAENEYVWVAAYKFSNNVFSIVEKLNSDESDTVIPELLPVTFEFQDAVLNINNTRLLEALKGSYEGKGTVFDIDELEKDFNLGTNSTIKQ